MKYNNSNPFSDMNVDPIKGTEIMGLLNADVIDLQTPGRFERLQEIISYLQNKEDAEYVIRRLTIDKNKDPIDHVWSFIVLKKEHDSLEKQIRDLNEGSVFDHEEEVLDQEETALTQKINSLKRKFNMLKEELSFYDK